MNDALGWVVADTSAVTWARPIRWLAHLAAYALSAHDYSLARVAFYNLYLYKYT